MFSSWLSVVILVCISHGGLGYDYSPTKTEFVAGSFIVTQKGLNEALHRHAELLRITLKELEQKDLPTVTSKWSAFCFRSQPSGKASKLRMIGVPSIKLQDDRTVILIGEVRATLYPKISVMGIGCNHRLMNDQTLKVSGDFKFQIRVQAIWSQANPNLMFIVNLVDSQITKMSVRSDNKYFKVLSSMFKSFQQCLNQTVQEKLEVKMKEWKLPCEIPTRFSPLDNIFVQYKVAHLTWTKDRIIVQTNGRISALIDGKNQTYIPNNENRASVPIDNWKTTSPKDGQSHLLQGVRVSTEFLNSLIWYATVTNMTSYSGKGHVLDSFVNGTISYSPPEIRVEKDELLGIKIPHGLVLATCRPVTTNDTKTLFKAEFYDLSGTGRLKLKTSLSETTELTVGLTELDFTHMKTKPFEPKLPLPESFEKELMRRALSKLQPVVNSYFVSNPIHLPHFVAPFVDAPEMHLVTTGNGAGFAEILSYCTCSKTLASAYSNCDSRSHICDGKTNDIDLTPFDEPEDGDDSKIISLLKEDIKRIFGAAKDVIKRRQNQSKPTHIPNQSEPTHIPKVTGALNFSAIFEQSVKDNTYFGFHLTFFEDDLNCKLNKFGSRAKVYWLWQTSQCTTLFVQGKSSGQYYYLNATTLKFGCGDEFCQSCQYPNLAVDPIQKDQCNELSDQSYHVADSGDHIGVQLTNETVKDAFWECSSKCSSCVFWAEDIRLGACHQYHHGVHLKFTQSVYKELGSERTPMFNQKTTIFVAVGSFILFVVLGIVIAVTICWCKSKKLSTSLTTFSVSKEKNKYSLALKNMWTKHIGLRFLAWNKFEMKAIQEDVIQNVMLVINGVMAVVFAIEWNSDNNPLLTLHNKFSDGVSISVDIFNTDKVADFTYRLNLLTYFVNITNAVLAFLIVITWSFTKTGSRTLWMKVRLLSSVLLLSSIFVVIASVIFSTYFDDLVTLEKNQGVFITDNQSMYNMASELIKVSLNGLSLTVISFTIVFLFHGVGGGLYFGTILFRLLHLHSKRSKMEILTTLLVILTVIQPFICLHPVIIWSQDSNHNSIFLILIILIWFLPVIVHYISKAAIIHGRPKFLSYFNFNQNSDVVFRSKPGSRHNGQSKFSEKQESFGLIFDFAVQVMEISFFLASFSIITHFLLRTEFNENRKNLQDFALPAIISVFCWMTTTSFLFFSLVLDESRKDSRLSFKDQDQNFSLRLLRTSLRKEARRISNRTSYKKLSRYQQRKSHQTHTTKLPESINGLVRQQNDFLLINDAAGSKAFSFGVQQKFPQILSISTQSFSSKAEIQKRIDMMGTNLTWPEDGTALDDVFDLYNTTEKTKSYMMIGSVVLFWISLAFDFASHFAKMDHQKSLLLSRSRLANFFGSLIVFGCVIVVGLPDYLEASHLDEICPYCGEKFNETVRQMAEFSFGLFFASLFSFQLIPILITIVPSLIRSAVLILVHPCLQIGDDDLTSLRMAILQQVIQFASFLTFPITFVSMVILQQYHQDAFMTVLIICFWAFPPFVLLMGLYFMRKYRRQKILMYIYYMYNASYLAILAALVLYSMSFESVLKTVIGMLLDPTFLIGSGAQMLLCSVVISDMLYLTLF
ncbi:hypothetical protein TCAL_01330 [Tigriopus californicus]|uniref:Uncharacterized protein n=1 Tax=Tigriopus californicus TaxID=6832 RepID=A0A553PC80_TIGCA|nr:hypothetical protein TCAL_01330 [Tigriopus californicus]